MHPLTVSYRRQLLGLRAATLRDLRLLWPAFDPDRPETWARFARPAAVLLQSRHRAAQALGVRYFEQMREADGVPTPNEVTLPPLDLDETHVARSMAATGLAGTYGALKAGKPREAALENGYVRAGLSAGRLVLSGATAAVLAATRGDARARGWVRATGSKPCDWCRGKSGTVMSSGEVFQAHDGCSCSAEPTWD